MGKVGKHPDENLEVEMELEREFWREGSDLRGRGRDHLERMKEGIWRIGRRKKWRDGGRERKELVEQADETDLSKLTCSSWARNKY